MSERVHYGREFRIETVRLVKAQGRSVADVANEIGVHENTVYKWLREFADGQENAPPVNGNEQDDLRKAKRRIADLEEEVEILKKAMAFFVKRPK